MQFQLGYKPARPHLIEPTDLPLERLVQVIDDLITHAHLGNVLFEINQGISTYKSRRSGGNAWVDNEFPQSFESRHPLDWSKVVRLRNDIVNEGQILVGERTSRVTQGT